MSIHRVRLAGSKKAREWTDHDLIDRFLVRKATFEEALPVDQATLEALRGQARALLEAGRFEQALDTYQGLVALGDLEPLDPFYWGLCHEGLGDKEKAEACFALANKVCAELEAELAAKEGDRCE
jgi:tetratricopeptide (TPR) repeat protein